MIQEITSMNMVSRITAGVVLFSFSSLPLLAQTTPAKPPASKAPAPAAKVVLPAAIDAAFKKAYPAATIKHVSKEKEGGKEVYEVESVDNGLARDLVYMPDGTVVSYEEQIAEASLPPAVASALKARYPKATYTRIEKLFEKNTMSYEIALKGAPVGEAVLTPEGKWISPKAK
jgi:hypothetical protein